MIEIRIKRVYGNGNRYGEVYVNLKQVGKGLVEMVEDFYPSKNSVAIKGSPVIITANKANDLYKEMKQYARPYIRHNENEMFEPMKNWK